MRYPLNLSALASVATFCTATCLQAQSPDPEPMPALSESSATADSDVVPAELPTTLPVPGFGPPDGLDTPADVLFGRLGLGSPTCFVLTPATCFEAAYKCYANALYRDSLAFSSQGLKMSNQARLHLIKAICEMHLGLCDDAGRSIRSYRVAALRFEDSIGLGPARERLNDPMRVRLEALLSALR